MNELPEKSPMSNYTPLVLNGGILFVAAVWLGNSRGYSALFVLLLAPVVFIVGNGFLLIKALIRRERGLALAYLLIVIGMAGLLYGILAGKIGG